MLSAKVVASTKPSIEGLETIHDLISYCARISNPSNQLNTDTSEKLIAYLRKHKHFSPFEMCNIVVEVNAPRDIARQLLRHRSFSFQEFSQRYADVDQLDNAFCIRELRMQDSKNRQNSIKTDDEVMSRIWEDIQHEVLELVKKSYRFALESGVAKETARAILPEGLTMSRLYVNGTIRSWIHYLEVRLEKGVTQEEHVMLARLIAEAVNSAFPVAEETWK